MLYLLITIIILIITIVVYLIFYKKKRIREESNEALLSLETNFDDLKEGILKKIEYLDSKPGLNSEEKVIRDQFLDTLREAEDRIAKEINDIRGKL